MTKIFAGRYSAHTDEPFVVFLIGMRINRLLAMNRWLPVLNAMSPMLQELYSHPEKGMMSSQFFISWRTILLVQYWRSFEQLEAFARNPNDPHLPAWREFNQKVGNSGVVGIYHETYTIQPGQFESIYGNMPRFGLAQAVEHMPSIGKRATARRRMGGDNEPAVPFAE
jgi:hypothetical protein